MSIVFATPSHNGANVAESPVAQYNTTNVAGLSHPVPSTELDYFAFPAGGPGGPTPGPAERFPHAMWVVTHENQQSNTAAKVTFTATDSDFADWASHPSTRTRALDTSWLYRRRSTQAGSHRWDRAMSVHGEPERLVGPIDPAQRGGSRPCLTIPPTTSTSYVRDVELQVDIARADSLGYLTMWFGTGEAGWQADLERSGPIGRRWAGVEWSFDGVHDMVQRTPHDRRNITVHAFTLHGSRRRRQVRDLTLRRLGWIVRPARTHPQLAHTHKRQRRAADDQELPSKGALTTQVIGGPGRHWRSIQCPAVEPLRSGSDTPVDDDVEGLSVTAAVRPRPEQTAPLHRPAHPHR